MRVLISIDRLGVSALGPYGNTWIPTPHINAFAARATLYDFCFAADVRDGVVWRRWLDELELLATSTLVTDDRELAEAATRFTNVELLNAAMPKRAADSASNTQFGALVGLACDVLSAAESPQFMWLHATGMAGPWDAPQAYREKFADEDDPPSPPFVVPPNQMLAADYDPDERLAFAHAYAGQVLALDESLGPLFELLHERGATVLLCGMRGYPLGEHLRIGPCDEALYAESTHVPVLIHKPYDESNRSNELLTLDDVPRLLSDQPLPARQAIAFASTHDRALRTPAWFYRQPNDTAAPAELYLIPGDRHHASDVANRCVEIAGACASLLATGVMDGLPGGVVGGVGLNWVPRNALCWRVAAKPHGYFPPTTLYPPPTFTPIGLAAVAGWPLQLRGLRPFSR